MSQEFLHIIEQVRREKDIGKDVLIDAIESAILSASRKKYKNSENIEARLNLDSGAVELYRHLKIVSEVTEPDLEVSIEGAREIYPEITDEAEEVVLCLGNATFGRIGAQTAKQVIFQKIRDAEKENLFVELKKRENDLVNGTVLRFDKKDVIIDLGRVEAILPYNEQSPRERYKKNDRVRVYMLSVQKAPRGLQVFVSRSHPNLVKKLFELEIPEIPENIVEIVNVVREAGGRSKIAVLTHDKNIDPVGTCVGVKGVRVQSIVQELCGEKVDIIKWVEEKPLFVGNALSPAQVVSVANGSDGNMKVVVTEEQLSFAIGKNGQNARLASKLTNCRIDITTQGKIKQDQELALKKIAEEQMRMIDLLEIDSDLAYELICAGFESIEDVSGTEPEVLSQRISSITLELARDIIEKALSSRASSET